MNMPPINHFQPWNDPGDGYKFGDFVKSAVEAPTAEPRETVTISAPPPKDGPKLAFQPWNGDDEGYTFKGWA